MYSCSCAPVRYSPSTITSACAQAASTSPFSMWYDLKTLSSPKITARLARESSMEKTAGSGSTSICTARRLFQQVAVRMRQQHDRFFGMINRFGSEAGLVVLDQRDFVLAGNIGGGNHGELVPGNRFAEANAADTPARNAAAHRYAMQHPGKGEV